MPVQAGQPWLFIWERAQGQPSPVEAGKSPSMARAIHEWVHGKWGSKATGESRRVGPGVDMLCLCKVGLALLLGGVQCHKQSGDCPMPMPWDPYSARTGHMY